MQAVSLSFAYGPMFARRRGPVIAPGLRHGWRAWPSKPSPQTATLPKSSEEIERCVIASFRVAESMATKANFADGRDCSQVGTRFFSQGPRRIFQERERLPGFLKASRIQRFISFCSVRIQASPCRISLSSFSRFPAFIIPAWRRNEVEFGRFTVLEDKSCDRAYMNRRVTNEWIP
jgi:hypothetical protein